MHHPLNWKDPKTFGEKVNYLKVYGIKDEYSEMVDKYTAKEWARRILGDAYIIPTINVYDSFSDINFDTLPNQFVMKTTHDSGGIRICHDKSEADLKEYEIFFKRRMNLQFFWHGRQPYYKNIKPRIIVEPLMVDESGEELKDYKLFCFDGEPKMIAVDIGRFGNHKRNLYTCDWQLIPYSYYYFKDENIIIPKPEALDELIRCARVLSKGIKFVRADFYVIGRQVYFGEMTFYPANGYGKFYPKEFGLKVGSWIKL